MVKISIHRNIDTVQNASFGNALKLQSINLCIATVSMEFEIGKKKIFTLHTYIIYIFEWIGLLFSKRNREKKNNKSRKSKSHWSVAVTTTKWLWFGGMLVNRNAIWIICLRENRQPLWNRLILYRLYYKQAPRSMKDFRRLTHCWKMCRWLTRTTICLTIYENLCTINCPSLTLIPIWKMFRHGPIRIGRTPICRGWRKATLRHRYVLHSSPFHFIWLSLAMFKWEII